MNPGRDLTIGTLARAASVNVETVRYYQRRGLLPTPPRGYGSIRRYSADDAERLRFIRAAQALGFSLKEIGELLSLERGGSCRAVEKLAAGKLTLVRERIAGLQRIAHTLTKLMQRCEASGGQQRCPIIQSLHTKLH